MKKFLVSVVAVVVMLAFVSGCVDRRGSSKTDSNAATKQSEPKRQEPGSSSR